jgi:hypothetical protein
MDPTADLSDNPVWEFAAYQRQRAGKPIPAERARHLAGLWPSQRDQLEAMAEMQDQADREMWRARRNGIAVIDNGRMLPPIVSTSTRPCARRRGAGRPGHRRAATRTRAGPDSDEPAPALALAPPPSAIYSYAASRCPNCGAVLLWSDGRLVCASRSCSRWGRPA